MVVEIGIICALQGPQEAWSSLWRLVEEEWRSARSSVTAVLLGRVGSALESTG